VKTQDLFSKIVKPQQPWWWRWIKRIVKSLLVCAILIACRQAWRHYQVTKNLDETLAELDRAEPGWRLEEIEAAREQIPEAENSAPVVVAAFQLTPRGWPPREFEDLLFSHLAPAEQLDPDVFIRLKKELADLQPALREARKLADMPRGRHRLVYERLVYETLLADQDGVRRIAHLLDCDAVRHDQDGDMENALISCRAILNTARSLGDEPIVLSQLLRAVCVMYACHAVERALAQGEPSSDGLTSMQRALDSEDVFLDFLVAARGERASLHATFDALESGDVPFSKLKGARPSWTDHVFGWFSRDKFREAHPAMLALMSRFVAIAQLPMHEQAAAESQLDQELRDVKESNPVAVLFIPAINKASEASRRKHAYLRCAIVALATERYRQERKKWPESLDQLCLQFLPSVPLDPFDGQPLRYRRLDDGVMIYSVGHDGIDNGGNLDREHPNQPGADVGCRLWDVAKRRQPPQPKPAAPPAPMPPPEFVPLNK
jgi:hypothetical protein